MERDDRDFEREEVLSRPLFALAARAADAMEWLVLAILAFVSDSRRARLVLGSCVVAFSIAGAARASKAGVILDPIQSTFASVTDGWMGNSVALGYQVFASVALVMALYSFLAYYAQNQTLKGAGATVIKVVLALGIPAVAMTAIYNVLLGTGCGGGVGIVCAGSQIGGIITGTNTSLTPDAIALTFVRLGWSFPTQAFTAMQAAKPNVFDISQDLLFIAVLIIAIVIGIIVIGVGIFLAVELLIATLQALFSLPLSAWAIGFSAAPGTGSVAAGVYSGIFKAIIRYVAIVAMVGAAVNIASGWNAQVATQTFNGINSGANVGVLIPAIEFMFGSIALALLTMELPKIALSALTGAPAISASTVASGAGSSVQSAARGADSVRAKPGGGGGGGGGGGQGGGGGGRSSLGAAVTGFARGGVAGAAGALAGRNRGGGGP